MRTELKLMDTAYVTSSIASSPWVSLFRQDLRFAGAVFYIGYSLADLDIRRLLAETDDLGAKSFFVVGDAPDRVLANRLQRFGTILPISTEAFASMVSERGRHFTPPEKREHLHTAIMPVDKPTGVVAVSDEDVVALYTRGAIRTEALWHTPAEPEQYLKDRPHVVRVAKHFEGDFSVAIVLGDIGNGKTCLLWTAARRLIEQGHEVFYAVERTETLFSELDAVLSRDAHTTLIIDNYQRWFDVLERVGLQARPRLHLLLASRTPIHDVVQDRLQRTLPSRHVIELSVDRLSDADIAWLSGIFDQYGLWGERAGWSQARKRKHLTQYNRGQMHSILLDVLASPEMRTRFSTLLEDISREGKYFDLLVTVLVLTVLQHSALLDTLVDIWEERALDPGFRSDPAIKQLVDVRNGSATVRSATAAQFLLRGIKDPHSMTRILKRIATRADALAGASDSYYAMLRDLTRFGNIQALVPNSTSQWRSAVLDYYEGIRGLQRCRANPHFWLQYAIAATTYADHDRAARYLKTARSLAGTREHYDTYMIDNHFARHLLQSSIDGTSSDFMKAFREARQIINNEASTNQNLRYPFGVAALYEPFLMRFSGEMSIAEQIEVGRAAKFLLGRARQLTEERRRHPDIVRCVKACEAVMLMVGPLDPLQS